MTAGVSGGEPTPKTLAEAMLVAAQTLEDASRLYDAICPDTYPWSAEALRRESVHVAAEGRVSPFQFCDECEHFRSEHENGAGYCRYGQSAVSDGCDCVEFTLPIQPVGESA